MKKDDILQMFRETDALLEGHFLLSSGLHSDRYFQMARVLQYPEKAKLLAKLLANPFLKEGITAVIGPAIGGIVLAYQLAAVLGARALFAEREKEQMLLRRGFTLCKKDRVLVCEDVVTTGASVLEVVALASLSAEVVGVVSLVDRSAVIPDFGRKFFPLTRVEAQIFSAEACPLCAGGTKAVKPGSRQDEAKNNF
ncbi:MAG: orotate phosphoribosyltransferase [Candidatus Ratteibacteria bacterium]